MKNPHDQTEYESAEQTEQEQTPAPTEPPKKDKKKKHKFSGAYYYVDVEDKKLAERAFFRTVMTAVAIMIQIGVLCLPQGSLEYITNNFQSYAYTYVMTVLVYVGVAVWLVIMNMVKYKFARRIPVERAPKNGFAHRAYFGAELFIAVNAVLMVFEISFVCVSYDYITLIAIFMTALATAAATVARQITHLTLKNSVYVPAAPDPEEK